MYPELDEEENNVKSGEIPNEVVIQFEQNANSVVISFNITDDPVALEDTELYLLRLELVTIDPLISIGPPAESSVAILDNDGEFYTGLCDYRPSILLAKLFQ